MNHVEELISEVVEVVHNLGESGDLQYGRPRRARPLASSYLAISIRY
jgi:hypothetical protein